MGKRWLLERRSFLRGAAGFAVALPALEAMNARAAPGDPLRYFIGFAGISTGRDGDLLRPDTIGSNYDTKRALQPLTAFDVTDVVSVVTDMLLPWGDAGSVPPGGRIPSWHAKSVGPLLSGVRGPDDPEASEAARGPTSDQIAAEAIGSDTTHASLAYRVQAAYYRGSNGSGGNRGRISYREDGGEIIRVDPIVSPRLAYESLFTGFVPDDPAAAAAALTALRRRKSAVDLVMGDAESLVPKLGAVDRQRMERHFDELRELENRLEELDSSGGSAQCQQLPDPGQDPPIGNVTEGGGDEEGFTAGGAYSNEELRAQVLSDLVAMAFACDLSRVAAMMYTMAQCFLSAYPLFGAATDFHGAGHGNAGGGEAAINAVSDAVAWHVHHFARLVDKLRATPDVGGGSILDSTALVLAFEGGWGFDPASGNEGSVHSSENMAALIAGHAGGLNPNGGVHLPHPGGHPTEVINTALRAVGVDHEMGEVSGVVDGLLP